MSFFENTQDTLQHYPEVWEDTTMRKMAIDIMLRMGTNAILHGGDELDEEQFELGFAGLGVFRILMLERYDGERTLDTTVQSAWATFRDLNGDRLREIIRFYSERIRCSCLKEKYAEIKRSGPKMGQCFHATAAKSVNP